MNLLFGPALRLVFSSTNFRSLDITILDERSSAHLDGLIESNLFILDETALSEVLLAFFLLLRLIVCDVGGVASLVIRVITLDNIIILSLLNHLNLVNASLAISTRTSSSNCRETYIYIITLASKTAVKILVRFMCMMFSMIPMMVAMISMVISISFGIERKSVHQGLGISCISSVPSELSCTKSRVSKTENSENFENSHDEPAYR